MSSLVNLPDSNVKSSLDLKTFSTRFKMATRTVLSITLIVCFYFLIVCILTHNQRQHQLDEQSINNPSDIQETNPIKNSKPEMLIANVRMTKSIKNTLIDEDDLSYLQQQQLKQPKKYQVMEKQHLTNDLDDQYRDCSYHLAFTLIERQNNEHLYASKLMGKFSNTLTSILLNINSTNLDQGSFCVHLITDDVIRPHLRQTIVKIHEELAQRSNILTNTARNRNYHSLLMDLEKHRPMTRYFFIDSALIEQRLEPLLPVLRTYFTHKLNSYYSNALFFYSLVLHQVIPSSMADRLILLDVDVQLDANILELFEEFGRFEPDEVIGLAYEQQPVYRHILHEYRRDNKNDNLTAGSPPPKGFPGFNSGVVLLHLRKLRESKLYNSLLNPLIISHWCNKYRFRGHLGDQDFYTLMALDHRILFHKLSCGWNRQLCQWWRFHGYGNVFDEYHRCQEPIQLYHGNCNSALPSLTYYGDFKRKKR